MGGNDMSKVFVLIAMIFCHVLDDFVLQSAFLADGKCRSWWQRNAPEPMYDFDYIVCLLMHAASWSFMIMLPIAIYYWFWVDSVFVIMWLFNVCIHAFVDNQKANKHTLNLIQDQIIHLLQIVITFAIAMWLF